MANSPKGYGNLHKNTSGAKNKGSDAFASYGGSIDTFVANPKNLGKHSSSQIYDWLKKIKMDPKPLAKEVQKVYLTKMEADIELIGVEINYFNIIPQVGIMEAALITKYQMV